jgi:lysophospholipase L1-like esterase
VLLDTVLIHQGRQYEWLVDHRRATPPGTGAKLACPLLRRLAALGVPILVVAQYDFYVWQNAEFAAEQRRVSQAVLKCAEAAGLAGLDLYDQTEKAVRTRGLNTLYLTWHPSPAGYRLIAEAIAAELERRHMAPTR